MNNIVILGHRGDGVSNSSATLRELRARQGRPPENTLAAFRKAFDEGAGGVELDVILSADGRLMVIHDEELNLHVSGASRTGTNLGRVSEKTCRQLQCMDVGQFHSIPTLEEVLELSKKHLYNIELKGKGTALPTLAVVQYYVQKGWSKDRFIISSFDHKELQTLKNADVEIRIGLLFEPGKVPQSLEPLIAEFKPYALHPVAGDVSRELLDIAKKHKLVTIVWTTNEPADAEDTGWLAATPWVKKLCDFAKQGYNLYLITDHPKLMREYMEEQCGSGR